MRPNSRTVNVPSLPVSHAHVVAAAGRLPAVGDLTLHFITPLRLVDREQLVKTPYFRPLLHRLVERIKSLSENFGGGPVPFQIRDLRDLADGVGLIADHTSWLDLKGYSTRLGREQVIGGLVGRATYRAADWTPFLPWLVWGTLLHAGKNAVKGDGWFGIEMGEVRVGLPGHLTPDPLPCEGRGTRSPSLAGRGLGGRLRLARIPNPLTPFPAREGGNRVPPPWQGEGWGRLRLARIPNPLTPFPAREGGNALPLLGREGAGG